MSFFVASKLWDKYVRKLVVIHDECRVNMGSGHRDAKTTVEVEGGGAYPFLDFGINLQDWVHLEITALAAEFIEALVKKSDNHSP